MAQVIQAGYAGIGTGELVIKLDRAGTLNRYTVTYEGQQIAYSTVDDMYSFPGTLLFGINRITGGTYRWGSGLCRLRMNWICK